MSAVDRISELPDVSQHHILSYLPIKDAARTSVLSKGWNNAWETLPCLNFNDERFVTRPHFSEGRYGTGDSGYSSEVVVRVIERLKQQHIGIEKFSLFIPPSWRHQHYRNGFLSLNSSLGYVGTTSLKELELINGIPGSTFVLLPSSLLSAKQLTVLTLTGFDLSSCWSSLEAKFTGLKKLALTHVDLDDRIMENLIMPSRSSLEALELKMCWGVKTIWLGGGFAKLKRLRVKMVSSMEVLEVYDAPEFVDLYVDSNNTRRGYPFKFNVKSCPRLRKVHLHCPFITENHLHQLLEYCLYLEELTIVNSHALSNINISSDSLKTLYLGFLRNLRKVDIFSRTLESLTFEVPSELQHVPTTSLNGSDITVGVRVNLIRIRFDLAWNDNLIQFLKNFRHTKSVTLESYDLVRIPKHRRDKLLSPFYGASDISFFKQPSRLKSMVVTEVVEYLLWLAPRAERVSIICRHHSIIPRVGLS